MLSAIMLPSIFCLSLFVVLCAGQGGQFYNPPAFAQAGDYSDNKNFTIGSTVHLTWTTVWDRISLVLWQNGYPDFEYILRMYIVPNFKISQS